MTVPRLYVDAPLGAGVTVAGSANQAHYLGTVLRQRVGAPVLLFNGRDGEWNGRVTALRRDQLVLTADTRARPQRPEADIWLAFALLKRDPTSLVVEKATELGASRIMPVLTERTNAGRVNEQRLRAIAIEAAEQCERLTVPRIEAPVSLTRLLGSWPPERPLFAAVERSDAPALSPFTGPAGLLVGPEGGFSASERVLFGQYGFLRPVALGPLILRAETACLVGMALLQATRSG